MKENVAKSCVGSRGKCIRVLVIVHQERSVFADTIWNLPPPGEITDRQRDTQCSPCRTATDCNVQSLAAASPDATSIIASTVSEPACSCMRSARRQHAHAFCCCWLALHTLRSPSANDPRTPYGFFFLFDSSLAHQPRSSLAMPHMLVVYTGRDPIHNQTNMGHKRDYHG
eukprot:565982-Rhodomonas_salina.1